MAAKQFIRPEIIFVFIRVHSWLKKHFALREARRKIRQRQKSAKAKVSTTIWNRRPIPN